MATTSQGKAIAAKNATKHGIYSGKPPTTDDQDLALYEATKAGLIAEFEPQTISEEIQIEQITMARVRLQRLWRSEAVMIQEQRIEAEIKENDPTSKRFDEMLRFDWDPKMRQRIEQLEGLLAKLSPEKNAVIYSDQKQLRLQREEGHLQRTIEKGIAYLQQQRDRRNGAKPQTVEAIATD